MTRCLIAIIGMLCVILTGLHPLGGHRGAAMAGEILIGLDADMSSASAQAGEAIRRGAEIAIAEVNEAGGLLGQRLKLVVRDHRGNPARGVDNLLEFDEMPNLLAVIGGLHTPVALYQLPTIHQKQLIYLGPWAAGTPVVENGYDPNYVFRVSVRDEYAGGFLVRAAKKAGHTKLGVLLERTGWGRSNERAIKAAIGKHPNATLIGVEWLTLGDEPVEPAVESLLKQGADTILLVAGVVNGLKTVKAMAAVNESRRVSILAHWGFTGTNFAEQAGPALEAIDLQFIQTFSFALPRNETRARALLRRYRALYGEVAGPLDLPSPVGTAHAYDIIHLLAKAVMAAGTLDRGAVRDALTRLQSHEGLVKTYSMPFANGHQDALTSDEFLLATYDANGRIVPVSIIAR